MAEKRIIELTNEKLSLSDGDFTIVDSEDGTYKFKPKRIVDAIPAIDSTLTQAGKAADAKAVGDALASVDVDTVNNARQLLSENYVLDEEPYHFRASGGDGADRVEECLVGGSVGWNQMIADPTNMTDSSIAFANGTNVVSGHKILFDYDYSVIDTSGASVHVWLYAHSGGTSILAKKLFDHQMETTIWESTVNATADGSINSSNGVWLYMTNVSNANRKSVNVFDLTTLFGPTIADYIFSLEQATAGAGVAWFKKYFPEDYYEYSAPTLRHVEGVSAKQVVGWNQFNGTWDNGYISNDGNVVASYDYKTTSFIPVIPSTTYYCKCTQTSSDTPNVAYYDANKNFISKTNGVPQFLNHTFNVPDNAHYLRITITLASTSIDNFCISLSDPTKNGVYEPYHKNIYPLDSTLTLRGIPKLDSNNKLYFDGDTYDADGTVTRKYGIVDLGTLNWYVADATNNIFRCTPTGLASPATTSDRNKGFISSKYEPSTSVSLNGDMDDNAFLNVGGILYFRNTANSEASAVKTLMDGIMLVYPLATPTTEEADPYTALQLLDPHGTEEFVSTGIVPVGHESHYLENLRAKIEGLPRDFSTLIAPTESTYKATQNYTVGSLLIVDNILYKVTSAIANGGNITPNTNVTATTLAAVIAAL